MNLGIRYCLARIATNDIIINVDDDFMPHKGLVKDMLAVLQDDYICGVNGVRFHGSYHNGRERFRGKEITKPYEVDLVVGYLTITHKKNLLGKDYSNYSLYNCEFQLAIESPELHQVVVPTQNFTVLKESVDENAVCKHPKAYQEKEKLYQKYCNSRPDHKTRIYKDFPDRVETTIKGLYRYCS